MLKLNKIIILGGFLFYFSVLNAAEIKEVETLEEVSSEIIGKNKVNKTMPTVIKKVEEKTSIKSDKDIENSKQETKSFFSESDSETRFDKNAIVDTFDKNMKNGVAYRKDETTPFTGLFGAVIDGKIDHVESYKNGLLDGESAWYSRSGKILLSEHYSKGKLNGEQKSYYEDGKLKSIVKYTNGRIDGVLVYDKNSKIKHESIFKNGTGIWKFYWSNGNLSEEGQYVSWKKDGVWKKYREDGSLDIVRTYSNGRLLNERWE